MLTKHDLSVNELMVFNSEYKNAEKSAAVAYLMLLGGHLGLHRFYLNRKRSGTVQLLLFITAVFFYFMMGLASEVPGADTSSVLILTIVLFGLPALALFIWVIVDLFLMPGMIKSYNAVIERDILAQIEHYRKMEQLAGRSRPEYEA
jgi:hypothetical protein